MCAAAGWFTRYVTCCVSSSSTVGGDRDDDVAQLNRKGCGRHCRSSRPHRRRHADDESYRCLNSQHADDKDRLPHGKSKAVKSADGDNGDDEKSCLPIFTATVCNNEIGGMGLMTGLEYVCCCERCDSVTGWYLTTVPALTADQTRCQLASSVWLQNYLVACGADRSRFTSGLCRGPQSAGGNFSDGDSGNAKDMEMSVSLISSCDIDGVDLLVSVDFLA
jgi:hypothetical protein